MLAENNRRVAASGSVVVHKCNTLLSSPWLSIRGYCNSIRCGILDTRIECCKVGLPWNRPVLHYEEGFDHSRGVRGTFDMANIILY